MKKPYERYRGFFLVLFSTLLYLPLLRFPEIEGLQIKYICIKGLKISPPQVARFILYFTAIEDVHQMLYINRDHVIAYQETFLPFFVGK